MKRALRLLSRFILSALLLALVLASLVVLSRYVTGFDPQRASPDLLVIQFLDAVRQVAVISVVIAAAVALFATIRSTENPLFVLLLLAACWTGLLIAANLLWPAYADAPAHVAMPERQVVRISDTDLYALNVVGTRAAPVIIHRQGIRPGTELLAEAIVDPDESTVRFPAREDLTLDLGEIESSYPSMVAPPRRISPLIRDVRGLNALLVRSTDGPAASGVLLSLVLGVFLLSCWTPARLTRWPLFNAVFVFLIIRGVLWLVYSLHEGELGRLLAGVVSAGNLDLVTAGALAFVALVFLLALFFLPPLSDWKRELVHE